MTWLQKKCTYSYTTEKQTNIQGKKKILSRIPDMKGHFMQKYYIFDKPKGENNGLALLPHNCMLAAPTYRTSHCNHCITKVQRFFSIKNCFKLSSRDGSPYASATLQPLWQTPTVGCHQRQGSIPQELLTSPTIFPLTDTHCSQASRKQL